MEYKVINTKGIIYIEPIPGSNEWYWGTDYAWGDLYEVEDSIAEGYETKPNRLIFIKYPKGELREPVKASKGQYFDRPVLSDGKIYFLMVDFLKKEIWIYKASEDLSDVQKCAIIDLREVKNCYNLHLATYPLMLTRQGEENVFEEIWPGRTSFPIGERESFMHRDGDKLYFSCWDEDEDDNYSEEVIVRAYPGGEIIETIEGSLVDLPNGEKWVLK